ncbi:MAG: futalosine hydrolase [Planctomycetes bacterium]|nr:futalosine hydrolase [Planctomycetota bacterium]
MPQPLILVPTERERGLIEPAIEAAWAGPARVELCGFGPVVAAARTAQLIAEHRPSRVLLVGIAGRLSDRLAIGAAHAFERVACHGVGAGSGDAFTPAESLGWPQWPGDALDSATRIGDVLPCSSGVDIGPEQAGLLLSACAASACAADVLVRLQLFPNATAEDMEGFAVAAACRLSGVPLDIVRGISNTAGDRDHSRWQIDAACRAAATLAAALLGGRS